MTCFCCFVCTFRQETHERILSNPEDEEDISGAVVAKFAMLGLFLLPCCDRYQELANLKQFMADLPQLKTKSALGQVLAT